MKKIYSQNKIYYILLLVSSIFTIVFGFINNNALDISFLSYLLFLVFTTLVLIYYFVFLEKIEYYPIHIFINLYFLACALSFFLFNDFILTNIYRVFANKLEGDVFSILTKKAFLIITFMLIFFNLGFYLSSIIIKKKKINLFPNLFELDFLRLSFFLLLIKLFLLFIFYNYNFQVPQIENPLTVLIAIISFYSLIFFKNNKLLNFLILFFVFVENIVTTFSLYGNLVLLLIFFTIIFILKKRVSIFILIFIFSWVSIGQSVKNNVRIFAKETLQIDFSNNQKKEKGGLVAPAELMSDNFVETRPIILRATEPIVSLIRVLEFEFTSKKIVEKDTLSILKYSLIPRLIYQDKPKQDYAIWFTDHFFDIYDHPDFSEKNVTYNISWPTDLYLNKGYLGISLYSFLLGLFLSLILRLFTHSDLNNLNFLFGLSIFSSISLPDYNISLMISPIPLQFIIMTIILKIILKLLQK